jgi:hypothetical protein
MFRSFHFVPKSLKDSKAKYEIFGFMVKAPAADVTDAPQPWGFTRNPVMKISFSPCNGAAAEGNWQGKTEVLFKKPVPVPLFPQQIPHELTRNRTRASAVTGWRLTAWAMARSEHEVTHNVKQMPWFVFNIIHLTFSCFVYVSFCHQLLHVIYIASNMFRLSYPAIIRELLIVDNKQIVASHRMVTDV